MENGKLTAAEKADLEARVAAPNDGESVVKNVLPDVHDTADAGNPPPTSSAAQQAEPPTPGSPAEEGADAVMADVRQELVVDRPRGGFSQEGGVTKNILAGAVDGAGEEYPPDAVAALVSAAYDRAEREASEMAGRTSGYIRIRFQAGPIKEVGHNGCDTEDVLDVLIKRLNAFQEGPFPCEENRAARDHLLSALAHLEHRTRRRRAAGIEGTNVEEPGA